MVSTVSRASSVLSAHSSARLRRNLGNLELAQPVAQALGGLADVGDREQVVDVGGDRVPAGEHDALEGGVAVAAQVLAVGQSGELDARSMVRRLRSEVPHW
jgi:hypothetical protein